MFKKITIAAAVVLLLGGLLMGRNLIPYATSTINDVRQSVSDAIPVETQIKAAREQLKRIDPEIRSLNQQVAKEIVAVRKLETQYEASQEKLEDQYDKMQVLRDHVASDDSVFVSHGRAYTNERVTADLAHRFKNYKTSAATIEKLDKIIELRKNGLTSAKQKLEEMVAQKRELEIEIEDLSARQQMVEVAKTASKFNFDNSQLSRTREMLENIETRLEVEAEMMNLTPDSTGTIPLGDEEVELDSQNIVDQIDEYFQDSEEVVTST